MDNLYPRCSGLDVHKKFVVACRITRDEGGRTILELRTFSTMTAELLLLLDWLEEAGVTHVAMESTGEFWKPVYNI
jgi:transposase